MFLIALLFVVQAGSQRDGDMLALFLLQTSLDLLDRSTASSSACSMAPKVGVSAADPTVPEVTWTDNTTFVLPIARLC